MQFSSPIRLELDSGEILVGNVTEARDCLMEDWPEAARGPRHRDALDVCLKVIDGHRSTIEAETALKEAAIEAGVLAA